MEERLQKIISKAGIASRRAAEELITEGRVRVNGQVVTELGSKADPDKDHIKVDGKLINPQQPKTYIMLNKPVGFVTTLSDPEGRPIVQDLLKNVKVRVYPVGRLDYNTEGLLLLTNDGEFAHLVTHPKHEMPKRYLVKIKGALSDAEAAKLETGVYLDDGKTAPARVRRLRKEESNSWVEITIHEGRKRQVRRMLDHVGHSVIRLRRVRVGNLPLGELPPGAFRHLTPEEVNTLRDIAEGIHQDTGARVQGTAAANKYELEDEEALSSIPEEAAEPEKKPKRDRRSMEPPEIAIMPKTPRVRPKKPTVRSSEGRPFRPERGGRPERTGQGRQGARFERPSVGAFTGRPRQERPAFGERRTGAGERPRRPASAGSRAKPVADRQEFSEIGPHSRRPRTAEREGGRYERPASGGYRGKPSFGRPESGERPRRPSSGGYRGKPGADRPAFSERGPRPSRPRTTEREGARYERPASGGYRGKPSFGRPESGERPRRSSAGGYRGKPGADRPAFSERGPRPSRPRTAVREGSRHERPASGGHRSKPAFNRQEHRGAAGKPARSAEPRASHEPREETWTSNKPFASRPKPRVEKWRKPSSGGRRPGPGAGARGGSRPGSRRPQR